MMLAKGMLVSKAGKMKFHGVSRDLAGNIFASNDCLVFLMMHGSFLFFEFLLYFLVLQSAWVDRFGAGFCVYRLARLGDIENLNMILVAYGGVSDLNHLCYEGMSVS